MGTSLPSLACSRFAVEQVLWDPPVWYAMDMSEPAKSALLEKDEEAQDLSAGEDLSIGYPVGPLDAEDAPQVSPVKCVKRLSSLE